MDNEILGTRILRMSWGVFDVSKASNRLLTSDWPIDLSLGATPPVITLPLTPTHLFVACDDPDILNRFDTNIADGVVSVMNAFVVGHARRYVFSSDERQATFIRNRMSKQPTQRPFFGTFQRELDGFLKNAKR